MNDQPLAGQVAIVTGAGRGLGRAIALALAGKGADVVLAARNVDQLDAVAKEVAAMGRRTLVVRTDVTDSSAVDEMVRRTLAEFGEVHILVNNSGTYADIPLLDMTDEDWDRVVDTNLRGTFLCSRAVGKHFALHGRGRAINIASNLGVVGRPGFAAYCASKAAVINFTRAVALEWAHFGAQMNAIAPGYFETEFNAGLRADPDAVEKVVRRIPAQRMGRPEEIGEFCAFLAGGSTSFMTGETIVLDGGETIR